MRWGVNLPGPFFVVTDGKRRKRKIDTSTPQGLTVKALWWVAVWLLATVIAPVPMLILTAFIVVFGVIPARWGIRYFNRKYGPDEEAEEEARKLERDNA